MTDKQDRRTEHGLRSPANDGTPRPKPPKPTEYEQTHPPEMFSGYNQTPEMLAAEDAAKEQVIHKQGELDGLRKAAKLICYHCANDWPLTTRRPFGWNHRGATSFRCPSSAIHDQIARLEKDRT